MIQTVRLVCGCKIGMSQHRLRKALSKDKTAECGLHGRQQIEGTNDGAKR